MPYYDRVICRNRAGLYINHVDIFYPFVPPSGGYPVCRGKVGTGFLRKVSKVMKPIGILITIYVNIIMCQIMTFNIKEEKY